MNCSSLDSIDNVKNSEQGGVDAWPTDRYLNIWVCSLENIMCGMFGVAYPPVGALNWEAGTAAPSPELDGVVLDYHVVGENNPLGEADDYYSLFTLGKTAVHEIGHYLGLIHIWGSGSASCDSDDGFEDTPLNG